MPSWLDYYRMLTAHGVLLALVFTMFFITGLVLVRHLPVTITRDALAGLGWIGYWLMLVGTLMAAYEILAGNATVLYTFYAPLKASPFFYIGATLLIVGTWFVGFEVIENVIWWQAAQPGPAHSRCRCSCATIDVRHVDHRDARRRGRDDLLPHPVVAGLDAGDRRRDDAACCSGTSGTRWSTSGSWART